MHAYMSLCVLCACRNSRGWRRASDPLELELQWLRATCGLSGIELRSFERAASALNHWEWGSPSPIRPYLKQVCRHTTQNFYMFI